MLEEGCSFATLETADLGAAVQSPMVVAASPASIRPSVDASAARKVFKQSAFAFLCSEARRYHDLVLEESSRSAMTAAAFRELLVGNLQAPFCRICQKRTTLSFNCCCNWSPGASTVVLRPSNSCRRCANSHTSRAYFSCGHAVEGRWLGSFDDSIKDVLSEVSAKVHRNSMAFLAVLSALAIGTQQLWNQGKVPRSVNEMLYQMAPTPYRAMVETILCIRSELSNPDNEDLKDAIIWDEGCCSVDDLIPAAFQADERKVVISFPGLRIHGKVVQGRAYVLNGDQLGKVTEGQGKPEPKDQLWMSFLKSLE